MNKPIKHRNPLSWYNVTSPVYDVMENVIGGLGPVTEERDWLGVQAYTKKEAISHAVKHWLLHNAGYLDNGENPYKGVTAEAMSPAEAYHAEQSSRDEYSEEYYLRRCP